MVALRLPRRAGDKGPSRRAVGQWGRRFLALCGQRWDGGVCGEADVLSQGVGVGGCDREAGKGV